MAFEYPDSIRLAQLPTPIEKLERLSKYLEGAEIFVKRDDITGIGETGNKIRKLEFLMAEAVKQNCDYVITCGGFQSNHARATAIAAAKLGIKSYLVLRNGVGGTIEGNLFLCRLVGAEIQYITSEEYERVDDLMEKIARDMQEKGHKPYVIPEGGSNAIGALGYIKAAEEIALQSREMKIKFNHIVLAVGSGGTYAGMLLGKYLFDLPAQIHGINVCDDAEFFVNKIYDILKHLQKKFQLDLKIGKKDIHIIDGYVGKGYGLSSQNEIDMIKTVAKAEGLILDPVYTGKTMVGLADQIRKNKFRKDEKVLFIHSGGIFGLFTKKTLFF